MAIGHLHVGLVQRATGGSSVDAAAYASRSRLTDERTGQVYDYSREQGDVVTTFIALPKNAPARFRDRAILWNEMEASDKRKNSRTARKMDMAFPHELTAQQREWLLRDYVKVFTRRGLAVDAAIHRPHAYGDQRNEHAHLVIPTRFVDAKGFAAKDRESNEKETLQGWRDQWEKLVNHHLERHGHEARISMKSNEAQGIEDIPQIHIGAAAAALERKGITTDRGDQHRAIANDNSQRGQEREQPSALQLQIVERRRQFLQQQHDAWQAMEQHGRDLAGRHSQARTGLKQLQQEADVQQHAQKGFFSFLSFLSSGFGLRKRTPIKRISREELRRRDKQRDDMRELEHAQEQERKQWEERRSSLLEQQAQARDLFERQIREQSALQRAFDSGNDNKTQPQKDSALSRMAARREAQRDRDGLGLER